MIIADTGFFLALFNARDRHHQSAITVLNRLTDPLITTHPVICETCYLLVARGGGISQECQFLIDISEQAFHVFDLQLAHFQRMASLIQLSGYGFSVDDDVADVGANNATNLWISVTGLNRLPNQKQWSRDNPYGG
jgi:predicted nucleic acid-binding protein